MYYLFYRVPRTHFTKVLTYLELRRPWEVVGHVPILMSHKIEVDYSSIKARLYVESDIIIEKRTIIIRSSCCRLTKIAFLLYG